TRLSISFGIVSLPASRIQTSTMHARDAAGRQVSLLNDESNHEISTHPQRPRPQAPFSFHSGSHVLTHPSPASRSNSSSPNIPELLRSDSYDSQTSNDPISPMTPSDYALTR